MAIRFCLRSGESSFFVRPEGLHFVAVVGRLIDSPFTCFSFTLSDANTDYKLSRSPDHLLVVVVVVVVTLFTLFVSFLPSR